MNNQQLRKLAEQIGINWSKSKFTPATLLQGYKVELEHGKRDKQTNVTNDNSMMTMKIALKHLKETPDYYKKLEQIEK